MICFGMTNIFNVKLVCLDIYRNYKGLFLSLPFRTVEERENKHKIKMKR